MLECSTIGMQITQMRWQAFQSALTLPEVSACTCISVNRCQVPVVTKYRLKMTQKFGQTSAYGCCPCAVCIHEMLWCPLSTLCAC
jgi:hypothetical protein